MISETRQKRQTEGSEWVFRTSQKKKKKKGGLASEDGRFPLFTSATLAVKAHSESKVGGELDLL